LWYNYGSLCMRLGDIPKAEECLREALALSPGHLHSLLAYGALLMGREKTVQAEPYFAGATKYHENDCLAWAALGLYYEMEGKDDQRRKCFKKVLQLEKDNEDEIRSVYVRAADFLVTVFATQMVERALSEEVNKNGVTIQVLLLLSQSYINCKNMQRARQYLDDLLVNHDKRNGLGMCLMGHTFWNDKLPKDAITYYEKALGLRHAYVDILELYRLGSLYLQVSKYYEAADTFSRACQFHPSASTWLGLGKALFFRGEFNSAEAALAEANVWDNHNPEVWGWLALTALKNSKIPEANHAYKEAIKNELQIASLYRDVGRQYLKSGQLGVAEQSIRRCLALEDDPVAHRLLGDTLGEQGEKEKALESYTKALNALSAGDDKRHVVKQMVGLLRQLHRVEEAAEIQRTYG